MRNYKRRYFSQSGYSYLQSCMLILIQRFYINTLLKELLYLLQLSLPACLMEEHSLRRHLLSHRELVNEAAASSFHPKVITIAKMKRFFGFLMMMHHDTCIRSDVRSLARCCIAGLMHGHAIYLLQLLLAGSMHSSASLLTLVLSLEMMIVVDS